MALQDLFRRYPCHMVVCIKETGLEVGHSLEAAMFCVRLAEAVEQLKQTCPEIHSTAFPESTFVLVKLEQPEPAYTVHRRSRSPSRKNG